MPRLATAALCLVAGAAIGVGAVVVHLWWWGLALALVGTLAGLVAVPGGWWRRLPLAVGWTAAVGVLAAPRPEGDFLIATNTNGYVLLAAAVVVLVAGLVGLRGRSRGDARDAGTTSRHAADSGSSAAKPRMPA